MTEKTIPDIIVGRLPHYLRALQHMDLNGQHTTSSQELGETLGISAAQIRKDLSQFGEFGKQGTGYSIPYLIRAAANDSKSQPDVGDGPDRRRGSGSRHRPLPGLLRKLVFSITMIFDNDPKKIGTKIGEFVVQDAPT